MCDVNSRVYWDERFSSGDWSRKNGREQSEFFYRVALKNMPDWLIQDVNTNALSFCDVGCAEGDGLDVLANSLKGARLTGVDFSQDAIEKARKQYPNYDFRQRDANDLIESYDVIFSSNTFEHFRHPQIVIDNVLSHCKKYLIMLLPFREFKRIEEHFFTFDYPFFKMVKKGFCCVYFREVDCKHIPQTQWHDLEILIVYMNMKCPDFKEKHIGHFQADELQQTLTFRQIINRKEREILALQKKIVDNNEQIATASKHIEKLEENLEQNRNAIMQIQFEAKQYKEAMLDARETYIWRTGVKIENLLRTTGIAFVRSVLEVSGFRKCGFWLTLRKGLNELFHSKKVSPRQKYYIRMCAEKFLVYKNSRDKALALNISKVSCSCKKGLISIVMPALNGEHVIGEAIESILNQTYQNFELIIINDGSEDRTGTVVEEYAQKDPRIKVFHQENRKIPLTLSKGFKMASGEFYTWVSVDNVMLPNCLEKLLEGLRQYPNAAMVYGNMRLIDAKGAVKRCHLWFEKPIGSGNVCLPESTNSLNTFPNNTIGAAFMYRSVVGKMLEDYSRYKYMLEDYDYWMRINSLFRIKHIKHTEPIYLYRNHKNSLTAHDKELGITRNRYKLMILDDFRRDYYSSALIWVVETQNIVDSAYLEFIKKIKLNGHILMSVDDIEKLSMPQVAFGACYVYFGENPADENAVTRKCQYKILVSKTSAVPDRYFDICIATVDGGYLKNLDDYRGWFGISIASEIFTFLDIKIKNKLLYKIEGLVEEAAESETKVSIIICTYKREDKLMDALWSVVRQSFSKKEYEILIIDNAPLQSNLEHKVNEFAKKYQQYENFIRYMAVPQQGLSYARNTGVWNARGEYLLFLDDDILADYYLIEEIYSAFKYHPNAGVVGGQIILDIPFPRPSAIRNGWEPLWSQFKVTTINYKEVTQRFEFPYGANYAVRRQAIRRIGGFRMSYGRMGKDFSGGEETALVLKMKQLGYEIGLQPRAKVLHRVNHERFTLEHVKNTIRSIVLTTHKFYKDLYSDIGWTRKYVQNQIKITKKEIKRFQRKQQDERDVFYKECMLLAWQEMLQNL